VTRDPWLVSRRRESRATDDETRIMTERRKTRTVSIGNVKIGSGHPVSVQSMVKADAADPAAIIDQINQLEKAGCEIARVAVKDMDSARMISDIKKETSIPLVADIHFDHKLAVEAALRGADKIRINPGNISSPDEINKVIDAASSKNIPVRIGVNSGSLAPDAVGGRSVVARMIASVLKYMEYFEKRKFRDLVISVKSAEVPAAVNAYRGIARECDHPLHIGITAAGLAAEGIVRSSVGIGALLMEGIGDTIRVSLTGDPLEEVKTARNILSAAGVRDFGPRIISCPTCGRCRVDLVSMVEKLDRELKLLTSHYSLFTDSRLRIAIMGCEVNGPGEAKNADIGIAFGGGKGAIFRRGRVVKTVSEGSAIDELLGIIKEMTNDKAQMTKDRLRLG